MDLKDILVTTPKNRIAEAAKEAKFAREEILSGRCAFYFRTFRNKPKRLNEGSRIYYVEDGFVRGFGTVDSIVSGTMVCEVTAKDYGNYYHAIMPAENWKWIKPIQRKGFMGWRYFDIPRQEIRTVGNWLDPKPNPTEF